MIIFPLTPMERVIFILIAIVIALIFSMLYWPKWWSKLLRKKNTNNKNIEKAEVDKQKLQEFRNRDK